LPTGRNIAVILLPTQRPNCPSLLPLDIYLPEKVVFSLPDIAHGQVIGEHILHQDFVVQLAIVRRVCQLGINDLQLLLFEFKVGYLSIARGITRLGAGVALGT